MQNLVFFLQSPERLTGVPREKRPSPFVKNLQMAGAVPFEGSYSFASGSFWPWSSVMKCK